MHHFLSKPAIAGGLLFCVLAVLVSLPSIAKNLSWFKPALLLPYDIPEVTGPISGFSFFCTRSPAQPIHDILFESVYDEEDPYRANVNPQAKEAYEVKVAPLRRFENKLLSMSNDYLRTREPAYALCALDWLYEWAEANGLLGKTNDGGIAIRQWALASFSSAYAQIGMEETLDAEKREAVANWLARVAGSVIDDYPENAKVNRKLNNHLYWAAWAVTMTGVAVNDRGLYEWGVNRAKFSLNEQMSSNGTLPLDLQRGKKALWYHVFAAAPLIMIAETAYRNGENLYEIRDGILPRLVKRILIAMDDPSFFEEKTGFKQDSVLNIHSSHYAWMEVYNARFPNKDTVRWLKPLRPVFLRRIGGDITFLYKNSP